MPILVGAAVGAGLDYASHRLRDRCSCRSGGSPYGTYAFLGAGYGATGPFVDKPRVGIAGGGASGSKTSWLSTQAHKIYKTSPGLSDAVSGSGRVASRAFRGLALGASVYDVYWAYKCD